MQYLAPDSRYVGKHVNGRSTRDKFIRSMDLASVTTPKEARAAYEKTWFSSRRRQYVNDALHSVTARPKQLFWPSHAFPDILDEIAMDDPSLASEIDRIKSSYLALTCGDASAGPRLTALVKNFESAHTYKCPDTYRSCWMNTGAYVTLSYGIKFDGLAFPGCATPEESLSLLKRLAMEVVADMDHQIDDRLFNLCYAAYAKPAAAVSAQA